MLRTQRKTIRTTTQRHKMGRTLLKGHHRHLSNASSRIHAPWEHLPMFSTLKVVQVREVLPLLHILLMPQSLPRRFIQLVFWQESFIVDTRESIRSTTFVRRPSISRRGIRPRMGWPAHVIFLFTFQVQHWQSSFFRLCDVPDQCGQVPLWSALSPTR